MLMFCNKILRIVFLSLTIWHCAAYAQPVADTFSVYFLLDDPALYRQARKTLDSLVAKGIINRSKYLLIVGYADYLGTTESNYVLSDKRAKNVQKYLLSKNVDKNRIKSCIGKGEIPRRHQVPEGYAPDRRVDIVVSNSNIIYRTIELEEGSTIKITEELDPVHQKSGRPVTDTNKPNIVVKELDPVYTPAPKAIVPEEEPSKLIVTEERPILPVKKTQPAEKKEKTTTGKTKISRMVDTLKVGQTFILDNIYFHTGKHVVRKESLPELDNLYGTLNDNPSLRIRIEGHVCCVPDDKDALDEGINPYMDEREPPNPYVINRLSLNRAMFIYHYLVRKGIDAKRMEYEGFGRSRPLIKNEKTMEDEDKNKRVEIRILQK